MLRIVSESNKLAKYQDQFISELNQIKNEKIKCTVSWRPSSIQADITWIPSAGIWFYSQRIENRWWNIFGIDHPQPGQDIGISCEINIPFNDINRQVAGGFAAEGERVYLVHRGNRFGGGSKCGLTKMHFWDNFKGDYASALDGVLENKVAIVARLQDPNLANDIAKFVRWIHDLKQSA